MTQASRSPSKGIGTRPHLAAGPLQVTLDGVDGPLLEVIAGNLALYDVPWSLSDHRQVSLQVAEARVTDPQPAAGAYLECAAMLVDRQEDGLRATTARGAELVGRFREDGEAWHMSVPPRIIAEQLWPEIEDLISLVLTTGWRRAGWVPLHAGAVVHGSRAALVCAASGGGKTTFALAMVRRGWRALGDDKLLLGIRAGAVIAGAIKHNLNVDPAVAAWFPEVGDLTELPAYSAWTPKRRVSLSSLWPNAPLLQAQPTDLALIVRQAGSGPVQLSEMSGAEKIDTVLRQTVIPRDPAVARPIATMLARLAGQVRGWRVTVSDDAYGDPGALDALAGALE